MYLGINISSQLFVIDIFLQEVLEEIKKKLRIVLKDIS